MSTPKTRKPRPRSPATDGDRRVLRARLIARVALEARENGTLFACFDGQALALGAFAPATRKQAAKLANGLELGSGREAFSEVGPEMARLLERLATHGFLEYGLTDAGSGAELVVVEPQHAGYRPRMTSIEADTRLVLSRFAYLRRRGAAMVLESPRAEALFKVCDPRVMSIVAMLAEPRPLKWLQDQDGFVVAELLGLLVDSRIVLASGDDRAGTRPGEGDGDLVLWDFHDLLFHTRSTAGRHANPVGGVYAYADVVPAAPAVRQRWPGAKIELGGQGGGQANAGATAARLLHERHSVREFDDDQPITIAQLSCFLEATARVVSGWTEPDVDGMPIEFAARPYPSGGASWGLELYLTVNNCSGLAPGFYHYDAGDHALTRIDADARDLDMMSAGAAMAMGTDAAPQVLITLAARFARTSWKYSSIAYSLILKDVGVLLQTFYLMATDSGLGGCAIGLINIDQFAKLTRLELHVEGAVGQFALGRPRIVTDE